MCLEIKENNMEYVFGIGGLLLILLLVYWAKISIKASFRKEVKEIIKDDRNNR